MTRFAVFDLASLPYPGVVETLDIEAVVTSMRDDLVTRFPAIVGVIDLESEPARKLIEVFAYREVLLRARINDAARQRMLAFAAGSNLDAIAAYYGVSRFEGEIDTSLRRRTQLAPEAMPHGGTVGSYRFLALQAAFPDLKDVGVVARGRGHVDVVLLGNLGQGAVTSEVTEKVRAKLLADDGAPATDVVTVVGAKIVPYAVSVTVHVALGQDPVTVRANATAELTRLSCVLCEFDGKPFVVQDFGELVSDTQLVINHQYVCHVAREALGSCVCHAHRVWCALVDAE